MEYCHNHQHCIDDALATARVLCQQQGARLTDLRQQVLVLIWQSHRPLGAYTLMDMLAEASSRRVAPPTVYRALEFLLDLGLIHRINSLNAYIGCSDPQSHQQQRQSINYFVICRQCQDSREIIDKPLAQQIYQASSHDGFEPQQQWLEVSGICAECQQQ